MRCFPPHRQSKSIAIRLDMNSKEKRVLATLNYGTPGRVPVDLVSIFSEFSVFSG